MRFSEVAVFPDTDMSREREREIRPACREEGLTNIIFTSTNTNILPDTSTSN